MPEVEAVGDRAEPGEQAAAEEAAARRCGDRRDDEREADGRTAGRGRSRTTSPTSRPLAGTAAFVVASARTSARPPDISARRGAGPIVRAVRGERAEHAEREVRQHRGERLREGHAQPAAGDRPVVRDAEREQPERDERLGAPPRRQPHGEPAEHRQQEVEADLDRQRPHRRVELQDAAPREKFCPKTKNSGSSPAGGRRTPGVPAQAPQQHDRADQRGVVGRRDAGDRASARNGARREPCARRGPRRTRGARAGSPTGRRTARGRVAARAAA